MAKERRARGDGGWHDLPDGRIKHSISLGFDAAGKRLRPTVYGATKAECRELMAQKLEKIRKAGGIPLDDSTTVGEWLTTWLERKKREVAEATHGQYESTIRLHIEPRVGRLRLDRMTVRDVDAWLDRLAEDEIGGRARQYARMVLTNALNDAMRIEMIDRNVAALVRAPRHQKGEFPVWDIDEALAFLAGAESDRFYALWVMWLTAGPRPHEMLGLRPEDVDLAGAVAKVTRQLRRGGQERVATKTMTSQRDLNLTPIAIEALRAHKERLLAEGLRASPWLFPSLAGTAMNYRNLIEDHYDAIVARVATKRRRELATAALLGPDAPRTRAAAGVPLKGDLSDEQLDAVADHLKIVGLKRIRPYDLRHTYATLSIKAGIPVHAVSESLGHSDIALTLRTYARVLKSMKDEHVERIQALFGTAKAAQPVAISITNLIT